MLVAAIFIHVGLIALSLGQRCGVPFRRSGSPLGLVNTQSIVGGQSAALGSWPWMVKLSIEELVDRQPNSNEPGPSAPKARKFTKTTVCGGTIIDKNYILTAAHCVYNIEMSNIKIKAGGISDNMRFGELRSVKRIIEHPKYCNKSGNDLALLQVDRPFILSEETHVNQACLPGETDRITYKTECYVTGWGLIGGGLTTADTLKELRMPYIAKTRCLKDVRVPGDVKFFYYDEPFFCGIHDKPGTGCGDGDSGGPMVCKYRGTFKIYGVLSRIGKKISMSLFADVKKSLDWIHKTIEEEP